MAIQTADTVLASRVVTRADRQMAVWTAGIVLVTLLIWTAASGSGGPAAETTEANPLRYVIYSLPLTLGFIYYATFGGAHTRIDVRGALALVIYSTFALTAMVANSWSNFYALRDFAIVSGYLLLFVFWFHAPATIADMALSALGLCMIIEATSRIGPDVGSVGADGIYEFLGLSSPTETGFFGSHGILESTLGFPLGVVVLHYMHHRKWRHSLIAGVLLLLAFKRITFLGVALAIGLNLLLGRRVSFRTGSLLAVATVVLLSVTAIFSTDIFESVADYFDLQDSSANSVSLGRYDVAVALWDRLDSGSLLNWTLGFGPGSADALVSGDFELNPHNDWLKVLFDYGILGFVGVHAVLVLNLVRHRLGIMMYIYTATLMMTDNIFIYMFYFPFVAMVMCVQRQ
jgi:hypothetical protein